MMPRRDTLYQPHRLDSPISSVDLNHLISIHNLRKRTVPCEREPYSVRLESNCPREMVALHRARLEEVRDTSILLTRPDAERGTEYLSVPVVMRGMDAYTRRSQRRAYKIIKTWKAKRYPAGMMIRISPRAVGSIWRGFQTMKSLWPYFTNALRMHLNPKQPPPYIWAVEPFQSGYCHYHMIVGRRTNKADLKNWIWGWWTEAGVDMEGAGVEVQYSRSTKAVKTYALKYVTKGCKDEQWSAMLWLSGLRQWGASRVLADRRLSHTEKLPYWWRGPHESGFVWRKPPPEWTYHGVIATETALEILSNPPLTPHPWPQSTYRR